MQFFTFSVLEILGTQKGSFYLAQVCPAHGRFWSNVAIFFSREEKYIKNDIPEMR